MARMSCASVVVLALILILAVDAQQFGLEQFKEACDKTPYPTCCFDLMKARHDDPMTYHVGSEADMAQYLMSIAAGIGHELASMARAERRKLPMGGAQWSCMARCASSFKAAATKLDVVDGELLENSPDIFEPVYRFVQSHRNVLAANWEACPVKPTDGDMAAKHKEFSMLVDIILALGKVPRLQPRQE